jgi:hypothetical protein
MNKRLIFFVSCILLLNIILGVTPEIPDEQINKIMNTGSNIINSDTGEINIDSIDFGQSAAQDRIDSINEWLNNNVSWLRFIFRMTPQISLLFLFDFIAILWGIVYLIIHSPDYWESENNKANYIVGTVVFFILFFLNAPYYFAKASVYFIDYLNQFMQYAIIGIIIGLVVILILMKLIPLLPRIIGTILSGKQRNKEEKKKENLLNDLEHQRDVAKAYNNELTKNNL